MNPPLLGVPIIIDPNIPRGFLVFVPKGLTPESAACMICLMAEDTHPPIATNSSTGSAPFFDGPPPAPPVDLPPEVVDALRPPHPAPRVDPTSSLGTLPRLADLSDALPRFKMPEPGWGNRFRNSPLPKPAYARGGVVSAPGPSLHAAEHYLHVHTPRPSATIFMRRTRRLGRQRWTWELREDQTATAMCFGRFYANYDEAVEYALRSTGGYLVSPVVRGDKPKGRV